MTDDAVKWEHRFRRPGYWAGSEPAPFVREILPLVGKPGHALELAMGEGRNATFLAEQGWRVTGAEQAAAGLDKTEHLARDRGVTTWRASATLTAPPSPGVLLMQGDLSVSTLPSAPWNLILVVNFLLRPLLPAIAAAIPPGGYLAYETYTVRQLEFEGGPRSREYLLEPGELRAAFSSLDLLVYREWTAGKGLASLLARKGGFTPPSR